MPFAADFLTIAGDIAPFGEDTLAVSLGAAEVAVPFRSTFVPAQLVDRVLVPPDVPSFASDVASMVPIVGRGDAGQTKGRHRKGQDAEGAW